MRRNNIHKHPLYLAKHLEQDFEVNANKLVCFEYAKEK